MNNLSKLRKNIDICDRQLVETLSKRFSLVKKIALYKKENNLKPLDSVRWQKVVDKIMALSIKKKVPQALIKSIFNSVHQESLTIEENIISKSEQGLPLLNSHKLEKNVFIIPKLSESPRIAIIGGNGNMGRFFTHIFREENLEVLIGSRSKKNSYEKSVKPADIIILSVPTNAVQDIVEKIKPFLRKEQLVVNFSSVQSIYSSLIKILPCSYIGIHPLFSPTVKNLYGQNFVFCHPISHQGSIFLKNTFENLGANILEMDPKSHDKHMALNQALIHAVHISASEIIKKNVKIKKTELDKISTPVSRLDTLITDRIFSQPSELYENILMMNPETRKIIEQEINILKDIKNMIIKKDRKKFSRLFNANKLSIGEKVILDSVSKTNKILAILNSDVYKSEKNINQNLNTPPLVLNTKDKIVFLGPLGTYSHLAAEKIFNRDIFFTKNNLILKNNIIDVFDSVQRGETAYGVVPAENSTEGIVKDTIHLFALYDVSIVKEYHLSINHSLMTSSPVKNILQIKKVKAHPQALGQCRKWLKENMPNALLEPTNSNVSGISDLKINEAVIASKSIASMYDLSVAAENISDNPDNTTMFYVIKRNDKKYSNNNKKAANIMPFIEGKKYIFLLEVMDRVGVLRDILDVMVRYNFNLSRIISIPGGAIGRYSFIVDIAKTPAAATPISYEELYEELYKYCSSVKLLGIV